MYMYMYMFMYMYMYMYMSTGYKANAYDAIPAALQRRVLQVSTAVRTGRNQGGKSDWPPLRGAEVA